MTKNKESDFNSELEQLKLRVRDLEKQLDDYPNKGHIKRNIPIILTGIYGYAFDSCISDLFEKWQLGVVCVLASLPLIYYYNRR